MASFLPYNSALDPTSSVLFVSDYGNDRIRRITLSSGAVTTLAGSGNASFADGY